MRDSDTRLLIAAAETAAEIATRHFGRDPRTWEKADQSPVTEADLDVDTALREVLTAARPDYGWLSEETPDDPDRLRARRVFVVDPIDGTRTFLEGGRSWCHSLAVVEGGVPVAAVVYQPLRQRMWVAEARGGARLNDTRLRVADRRQADGAQVLAGRPTLDPARWPGGLPLLGRHYRPSLAYRLALVAEGRFDAMVTLMPAWEWDIAAGALILGEAGGTVTDRAGAPLRFNAPGRRTNGVLAAGPALHDALLQGLTGTTAPAR